VAPFGPLALSGGCGGAGRGITVAGTPERGAVLARTRELVEYAYRHGFGREEIIKMIESLP
jgi:hypothetical protein